MREIKFRGISKETKEWVYGSLIKTKHGCWIAVEKYVLTMSERPIKQDFEFIPVIPETVGQDTGLKDMNGKEIYEGDIFKAPHDFGPGGFEERISTVTWDKEFGYQWNYWKLEDLEIIGNIHEHSHLLGDNHV